MLLVFLARVTLPSYLLGCTVSPLPLIHCLPAAGHASRMPRSVQPSQLQTGAPRTACTLAGGSLQKPKGHMLHRFALCRQVFQPIAAQQPCRVKVLAGSLLLHTMSCAQPFLSFPLIS